MCSLNTTYEIHLTLGLSGKLSYAYRFFPIVNPNYTFLCLCLIWFELAHLASSYKPFTYKFNVKKKVIYICC
jgi:hypothetical protein